MPLSLRRWFRRTMVSRNQGRKIEKTWRRRLGVESLENRTMLSISLPTGGAAGAVTLTGLSSPDQFVVRLDPSSSSNIQFSDNGGSSFQSIALTSVTQVNVLGLGGGDTLTIDNSNGFVGARVALPITFDPGNGFSRLILTGNPSKADITETYTVGATSHSGTLNSSASAGGASVSQAISFSHLSSIVDTVPASTLTINANDDPNNVQILNGQPQNGVTTTRVVIQGMSFDADEEDFPSHGRHQSEHARVSADHGDENDDIDEKVRANDDQPPSRRFTPITFANKTTVNINTLGGDDFIALNNKKPAAGLTNLNIDGGAGTNVAVVPHSPPGVKVNFTNTSLISKDADDVFVENLFAHRLGRGASQEEVAFWTSVARQQGHAAVATDIDLSPEAHDHSVALWYQRLLGRQASAGEAHFWGGVLDHETQEQVLISILSSQEFYDHAQTQFHAGSPDANFVTALYETVLNRTPTQGEVTFWVNALSAGSRSAVVASFVESNEFRENQIANFYTSLLNRAADAPGLNFWVNSDLSLAAVRASFAASDEFRSNDS